MKQPGEGNMELMRFRVWAPSCEKVELVLEDRSLTMERRERGYWEAEARAAAGARYAYRLDGSEPLPDPRSSWQPDGVDERSCIVDHAAFEWSDHAWSPEPLERWVIYELHVGAFTQQGTFDAAIERLDHLVRLGVNAIEVMPVNAFPGARGWGYDGVGLWAVQDAYGGPDGFKRFVDACHARDVAVVLDVVYNHLGPSGNHLAKFGPYFTDRYSTPWGDAVNLDDADSDEVRAFFIENAVHWIVNYHVDALRIDAVHALLDRSAKHLLEELSEKVEELAERTARPIYLIAESDLNDPRMIWPRSRFGFGMDAQWSDDFHHALHSVLTGETDGYYADFGTIAQLATALERAWVYAGEYSPHRDRRHGRPHGGPAGHRFLAYCQNHDQIGNRAAGDRLSHLVSHGDLKIAAALTLLSPFVPMLFMGEEWAATTPFQYFTDHHDPALGKAVTEGRRREFASFGWDPAAVPDPQEEATFEHSKLDWDELGEQPHADMIEWYRALIDLRRKESHLQDCDLAAATVVYDEETRWLTLQRGPFTVACNFGDRDAILDLPGALVLSSGKDPATDDGKTSLPPHSVAIFRAALSRGSEGAGTPR